MNFIKHQPKKIRIKGYKRDDCTVNAIGNALGISYDLSRKIMQTGVFKKGRSDFLKNKPRTKNEFMRVKNVRVICEALSVDRITYMSKTDYSVTKDARYLIDDYKPQENSLAKFAKDNPEGTFIVLVKNHLTTVINGTIVDTWDSSSREVLVAYRINVETARDKIEKLAEFYKMNNEKHIIQIM